MNKIELIARIAEVSGRTKNNSKSILEETLSEAQESLEDSTTKTSNVITFCDFTSLNKRKRKKGKRKKNWQ